MQDTYTIKLSQITKALEDGQTITAIINGEYYDIEQDAPKLRTLAELTPEELGTLYEKSDKLKQIAQEQADFDAEVLTDDIFYSLRNIKGIDYEISAYGYSYMKVKPSAYEAFLDACEGIAHDFCIFTPEQAEQIKRAKARASFYYEAVNGYEDISDDKFDMLDKWITGIVEATASAIVREIVDIYESTYDPETIREALECAIDNVGEQYTTDGEYIYELAPRSYK